jgi:rhodanese-related sulfurtransferase
MGNVGSIERISFEDVQYCIRHQILIINTLPDDKQDVLIRGTIPAVREVETINQFISKKEQTRTNIMVYGENSNCEKLEKKANDLVKLGFARVYIYIGGMFEWMLLRDIYGEEDFPITRDELDILKFKPTNKILAYLLE